MRVMSFNANGIRAVARKGFFEWFQQQNIDVLCIQETKGQEHQFTGEVFVLPGYHRFFFDAHKPGYSGTAIYTRQKPDAVKTGLGWACPDTEGRYIQADFGNLSIASLYLPSGSSGEHRQAFKFEFMEHYEKVLKKQIQDGRDYIICGDWNIVHKEIDIKNFKSNQQTSGCLPEERAWLDKLITEIDWVDAFRVLNQEAHQYTWWSHRANARANNVGWRIDYQMISSALKDKVKSVEIFKDPVFSDHAPLLVEYV